MQCQEVLDPKEKRDENPERAQLCLARTGFCKTAENLRKSKQRYENSFAIDSLGQTYEKRPSLPKRAGPTLAANWSIGFDSGLTARD